MQTAITTTLWSMDNYSWDSTDGDSQLEEERAEDVVHLYRPQERILIN